MRGEQLIKLNNFERHSLPALVAARIAFQFDRNPALERVAVYYSANGFVMARPWKAGFAYRQPIGVYTRDVTIGQLVEDLAA